MPCSEVDKTAIKMITAAVCAAGGGVGGAAGCYEMATSDYTCSNWDFMLGMCGALCGGGLSGAAGWGLAAVLIERYQEPNEAAQQPYQQHDDSEHQELQETTLSTPPRQADIFTTATSPREAQDTNDNDNPNPVNPTSTASKSPRPSPMT